MADSSGERRIQFWRRSLVARLVFYFLLLSLVTVVLLGAISYLQSRRALERSVLGQLEVAATLKKDAIRQWLDEQLQQFLLLADRTSAALFGHEEGTPQFQEAYGLLDNYLGQLVERKPGWREVFVLSEKSKVLFSTEKRHEGDHRILDQYFVRGREGLYIEKVYPSPVTYTPTMTFSAPLGGNGVLAVHLNLERLNQIVVERTGLGERSESYLVDRFFVQLSGERFGREGSLHGVQSEAIRKALDGVDGEGLYVDFKGTPVLGVYRWIEEMDAALLIEIPQEVAFAPARQMLLTLAAVGGGIAIFLSLGTYVLARQIARPVLRITEAAVRIASGDRKIRAPVVTDDEIGVLAATFNLMTETLEVQIARRTQAQRELEAKNAELERFTYTVSHDLKSPLVTIRGFLGMLEKDAEAGDKERMADDIARIWDASETMRRLLEDLLELSRIGGQLHPPEDVDLDELVAQALAAVEGEITERGVEVSVASGMGTVRGDRVRILEVFQNLIANAAAFQGDQEEPRVEIGAVVQDEKLLCHVRDNGMGIDPKYHGKIFGLFERLDAETGGTGVGLALVQRIVELHGGHVWVESTGQGEGSTFYFTLPPVKEHAS